MAKKGFDIYKHGVSANERLAKIKADRTISIRNKEIIGEFDTHVRAIGVKDLRRHKYLQELEYFAKWIKSDFDKVAMSDIEKVLAKHVEINSYSSWTRINYKQCLKRLYKWLCQSYENQALGAKTKQKKLELEAKTDHDKELVAEMKSVVEQMETTAEQMENIYKQIHVGTIKVDELDSEALLTEEDVYEMIRLAPHPRSRALMAVHWDAGTRIGALLTLQIKNIELLGDGAIRINQTGKTGPVRQKLWFCASYVREWLKVHPFRSDPEAPLFCHINESPSTKANNKAPRKLWKDNEPITYPVAIDIFRRAAERAGIKSKRITSHAWRKGRACDLASKGWSEAQMWKHFSWGTGSKMARIYISKASIDTEAKMDETYNMASDDKELNKSDLRPVRCPRCKQINEPKSEMCIQCFMPFTESARLKSIRSNELYENLSAEREKKMTRSIEQLTKEIEELKKSLK